MNVLFITSWYPREDNPVSGVFVREHAKAVSLIDQVAVLYGYQSDKVKRLYEVDIENESNLKIFRIGYKKLPKILSNILYLYSMFRAFQKIRKQFKPDIIHAHVYTSGFLGVILGKLYNIPVIITDHALLVEEAKTTQERFKNVVKVLIARFTLNRAQLLLPVSSYLCAHIKSLGIRKDCDRVLPNIVDIEIFYPVPNNIREDQTKRILFVGRLHPLKGIDYLLNALGELLKRRSDFHLDIIGYGAYEEEYKRLATCLGLSDKVKFHGRKKKEEIAEYMRSCDFLVLPSLWEAFGVVLIEAMACGKPVIATSCGQKEVVNEETGILVPSKDSEALAEAIDYMLDHYSDYSPEKISRYILERFSPKVVGRQLHEAYLELIKGGGG